MVKHFLTSLLVSSVVHLSACRTKVILNNQKHSSIDEYHNVSNFKIFEPSIKTKEQNSLHRNRWILRKRSGSKLKRHRRMDFMGKKLPSMSEVKNLLKGGWSISRKEAKKIFEAYYKCQQAKVDSLRKEEFPIKAALAVEGEKVVLTCQVCFRPDQDLKSQKAVWQFLRHEDTGLSIVRPSRDIEITDDSSLVLNSVDIRNAGQYYCVEKHDYAAVWQLDVFLTDKRRFVRFGRDDTIPEKLLWSRNLRVFTMWSTWGECNTCDRPGSRSRVGQCTVRKIHAATGVLPRDYPMMALYPAGVPCHSTALPRHIRQNHDIGQRFSETLVMECNETCPTEPPARTVTDSSGQIVEVLAPGFFPIGEKPPLPRPVIRKVLYEPENSHLILKCPGERDTSVVRWLRGKRPVDPAVVRRQTRGRVWVDSLARIHVHPLLLSDTAVYGCWEKALRVATLKVLVVDESAQDVKDVISYAGLALTVGGALVMFFCLCCKKPDKSAQ